MSWANESGPHYIIGAGVERSARSLLLGVLGMPGNTAYFGLLDICRPGPGRPWWSVEPPGPWAVWWVRLPGSDLPFLLRSGPTSMY